MLPMLCIYFLCFLIIYFFISWSEAARTRTGYQHTPGMWPAACHEPLISAIYSSNEQVNKLKQQHKLVVHDTGTQTVVAVVFSTSSNMILLVIGSAICVSWHLAVAPWSADGSTAKLANLSIREQHQ